MRNTVNKRIFERRVSRRGTFLAVLVLGALALVWAGSALAAPATGEQSFTIAVVRDGPPPDPASALAVMVEAELNSHLPGYYTAKFKRDPAFDAGWDAANAAAALEAALADPEVDLVLVDGAMVTMAAAGDGMTLAKPVVSVYVQRADLMHLPRTADNHSAKRNLAFIAMPSRVINDVELFHSLIPFETLHVLAGETDLAAAGDITADIAKMEQQLDTHLVTIPAGADADALLASLGDSIEAVYLTGMPRLSTTDRKQLIDSLTGRGIPTFSLIGHSDVHLGVLGALSPDITDQAVRRAALNLSRLIRGETTGDLPVLLTVDSMLLINARTAVAVGYTPDPETRLYASFLDEEAFEGDAEELSLEEAMRMAEAGNTTLAVEQSRLMSIEQDEKLFRSPLLPQMQADFAHARTDSLATFTNAGIAADGSTMGRAALRQMIYDDQSVSNWRASKRLSEAGAEMYERTRLDIRAAAGETFLGLALARALYKVRTENIRLTRENLELANLRLEVGYSGRDEIYRWEAQLANERSQLMRSAQSVANAMIALNQTLGTAQDRRWRPREIEVQEEFYFAGGRLDQVLRDPPHRQALRDAMVEMALERSPEMHALARTMEAQEIGLAQLGRSYFLPSFFVDLYYANELISGDVNTFPDGDDSYGFMVGASYPFFEGGRKAAARAKGKAELEGLERQLALAGELVEQQTRTALNRVASSFARIALSRESAEVAAKNLELVQEKYAEGVVNVTDLDSAQNQQFVAEQEATIARYEFLLDLVALQRAISLFEDELEPGDMERLIEQVEAAAAASREGQGQ